MTETTRIGAKDEAESNKIAHSKTKTKNRKKANSLLFRPQLKAHNSMLKVIENNCKSNSPVPLKIDIRHKTNVAA